MAGAKGKSGNEPKSESFESPIPDNQLSTLSALVAASQSATGFLLLPEDIAEQFDNAGFADRWKDDDGNVVVEDGKVKCRATDAGTAYSKEHPATPNSDHEAVGQAQKPARQASGFVRPSKIDIDTDVPMPKSRRTRGEGAAYPFDQLEIGQSFHIAATEAAPDPAKSVASSVSSANIRYSEDIEGETTTARKKNAETGKFEQVTVPKRRPLRKFFAVSVGSDDPKGPGVRVWRDNIEDGDEADQDEAED